MSETSDNEGVLQGMRDRGVDLTLPRSIEFAIDVPDERTAQSVAAAVASAGYEPEVYFDEGEPNEDGVIDANDPEFGPSWTVYAPITMAPTAESIAQTEHLLQRLAGPVGGRVDGWSTAV